MAEGPSAAAVLSLLWIGGIGSLGAILAGHLAMRGIRRSKGTLRGYEAALFGTLFGYAGLALTIGLVTASNVGWLG